METWVVGTVLIQVPPAMCPAMCNEARMATGTVKWFNTTKGYGFIRPDDGDKDAFVHVTEVERSGLGQLNEGQRISFEIKQDTRGLKAVNLAPAD